LRSLSIAKALSGVVSEKHQTRIIVEEFTDTESEADASEVLVVIDEDELYNWDLDVWQLSDEQMMAFIEAQFRALGLLSSFKIPVAVFRRWLAAVRDMYHPNPFHNFYHAFHVTHMTFLIISTINATRYLQDLDILATMIAAVCHDLDHPGHTNAFENNRSSPLALTHLDDAVLEHHHAHMTFDLLFRDNGACNILKPLSAEDYKAVRRNIIEMILHTDMRKHNNHVSLLTEKNALRRNAAAKSSRRRRHSTAVYSSAEAR
jgi:hypothetical protein